MIRLFVALELPDDVRARLAGLAGGVPGARWVPQENLHLTLGFIGNVPESAFADIEGALARVAAPGFDLAIDGVGHFARGRAPTQLWAGVARNPALDHLQARVEHALAGAGVAPEKRKFMPHVTLARLKGSPRGRVQDFIAAHGLLYVAPFAVESFALFSSFLGHAGAIYHAEARFPLDPATA